jgi:hypothetical protein
MFFYNHRKTDHCLLTADRHRINKLIKHSGCVVLCCDSELKYVVPIINWLLFQGSGVSDAVAAVNQARLSVTTCDRRGGGGAHDAADAYEADAVAVGGGLGTRRPRQLVVEAVLETPCRGKSTRSGTLKEYSKVLEYEYREKTNALGTLKRYSIIYSIVGSDGPTS